LSQLLNLVFLNRPVVVVI